MVLSYIFHLSDLHIRNGDNKYSRYKEYKEVFKETIKSIKCEIKLKKLSFEEFIIVITGDIFHNKNVIGNYGLIIYRKFIQALSEIGRTYIISGNHDYDQCDIDKPSLVYSSTFAIPNIFVLNYSTAFAIDDIGISFVSIDKTLDHYKNSGRIKDLPKFPDIEQKVKYKIALFHGSFASAKLYNGNTIEEVFNPYPLEWVKDFDYVLLGDIHKRQVFTYKNKTICGYAGSLIQQNFGEDIISHGYLLWDIYNKDIKKINVYNNNGFINIKEGDNNDILIRINGKYEKTLEEYIKNNIDIFPKNINIKKFTNIDELRLNTILQKYNIKYDKFDKLNILRNFNNTNMLTHYTNIKDINMIDYENYYNINIDDNIITEYFKPFLTEENQLFLSKIIKNKEVLLLDVKNYPEELQEEIIKINKELLEIISISSNENMNSLPKSIFKIKYLEWEGLLCYENKNWLNMNDLYGKIFMVKGKNGTGKSAIYDILLLAIWGENTKKSAFSCGIVNNNKNKGYTIIDIELNDKETYRIIRNYSKKVATNKLLINNSVIYKHVVQNNNNISLEIIKKDTACNNEILNLFGNLEDFLSTSMITQNINCDILKLDFKSVLEVIDKSFKIEYIYNLYNIFNKTINKYKGLHKYIDSKKDVYIHLIKSYNYQYSEEELYKTKAELEILNNTYNILNNEYDNNKNLISNIGDIDIILNINSNELKNKINFDKLISEIEYNNYIKRLTELEYLLKDKDIVNLSKQYKPSYELNNETDVEHKPCNFNIIENERKSLTEYFELYDNNIYGDENDIELNIYNLKEENKSMESTLSNLVAEKPLKPVKGCKIDKPIKERKKYLNEIISIFGNLESLDNVISNISNISNIENDKNVKSYENAGEPEMTLDNYNIKLEDKLRLKNTIDKYGIKIRNSDIQINKYFKERENLIEIAIPIRTLDITNLDNIIKELNNIDYEHIVDFLKLNQEKVDDINKISINLKEAEVELLKYMDELNILKIDENYHYDPECKYCCKRNWVKRIKELEIIINNYNDKINTYGKILNDENIKILLEKFEDFKNIKERYVLLQEWYEYLKYKNVREEINKNINKALENKKLYNKFHIDSTNELQNINNFINTFNNKAIKLRENLNTIINYEKYKKWEENYQNSIDKMNDIKKKLINYEKIREYNKNIKPRIMSYRDLLEKYNKWHEYDNKINIIYSKKYIDICEDIENYKNNELYNKYIEYTPVIKRNIELKSIIEETINNIRKIDKLVIEQETCINYNKENLRKFEKLDKISINIANILSLLETIITNFQDFRINMYNKIILNKLLINTNKMLKNISHKDTKPFELDYIINVTRDIIHINWLIKNTNITNNEKQIISINQASGYQQFVISLALRLCLFGNKTTCKQLFIDEGFVSFDKYNLSIVPEFLKSLMSYFDSIIIVSHIDLIQDIIEDNECIAEINYNNITSVSNITYGKKLTDK
jgi:DNA repair exonuclease SbcCD nuclease subunit/DNA repair exonuclease SbcCD ATPase subunit